LLGCGGTLDVDELGRVLIKGKLFEGMLGDRLGGGFGLEGNCELALFDEGFAGGWRDDALAGRFCEDC
jgi:hypothetical protein